MGAPLAFHICTTKSSLARSALTSPLGGSEASAAPEVSAVAIFCRWRSNSTSDCASAVAYARPACASVATTMAPSSHASSRVRSECAGPGVIRAAPGSPARARSG